MPHRTSRTPSERFNGTELWHGRRARRKERRSGIPSGGSGIHIGRHERNDDDRYAIYEPHAPVIGVEALKASGGMFVMSHRSN